LGSDATIGQRLDPDFKAISPILLAFSNRADGREKLQTLYGPSARGPTEQRHETQAVKITAQPDDPFDKIIVA
jgi:hypothetical protein